MTGEGRQVSSNSAELLSIAEQAARVGGAIAREAFGTRPGLRFKADRSELTHIDEAAERAVIKHIRSRRPDDAFIGEEAAARGEFGAVRPGQHCWAIDPLDGTRNFVRGLPAVACSVAVLSEGVPIAGAVYDPLSDCLYSAAAGRGMCIDGAPVPAMDAVMDAYRARARMLAAIPSLPEPAYRPAVMRMIERYVVRTFGSAALHLAWIAAGRIDAALQDNPKLWDVAAGWLLIRESGGEATRPDGAPLFPLDVAAYRGENTPVVAGRGGAHAALLALVRDTMARGTNFE